MHYFDRKCYEYRIGDLGPKWPQNRRTWPYGNTGMTDAEQKMNWCANLMQHTSQTLST